MSTGITGILTDRAPKPAGHYTQAVVSGAHVFVSGQLPIRPDGRPLDDEGFEAQARQAFTNLRSVVEAAGGTPADVVAVRIYVVDYRPEKAASVGGAFREFFSADVKPASTWIGVAALADPGFLIEVEAVAVLD